MARSRFYRSWLIAAALVAASPAYAQFGSIFRDDGPPRPPANVPEAPPYYSPQRQSPPSQQPYYPSRGDVPPPPQYQQRPIYTQEPDDEPNAPRPPGSVQRGDVPPAQPMPPPMSLPPSSRPGGGTIQSQDLAPLPGVQQAPPDQRPQPQQAPQQANTPPNAPAAPGQQPQPGQPGAPQEANQPPPSEEVVVEPPPQRIANPTAVFSGLDKITGRIISFDVALNETVQFGALQVTPRVCYSRPPTETPNTDSFVEVDEVTLQGEIKRIFTGWMFAASPGLHAVEHPIYDVWLTDCKGAQNPAVAEAPPQDQPKPAAKPARPAPAPRRPAAPPAQQPRAQQQPAGALPALR
jgi:hypothetical protein